MDSSERESSSNDSGRRVTWASDDDGNANEGTGETKSSADNGEAASPLYDNPNLPDKSSKTN